MHSSHNPEKDLKKQIHPPIKFAFVVIGIALGIFVLWGIIAPLDSAAVAPGFITLSGNRKTIQHLEGGVIERILVKDGDTVFEGQKLIALNDTTAKARVQIILSQLRAAKATENRLLAEKCKESSVNYNDDIFDITIPEVQKIINTQNELFETRIESIKRKLKILWQKIVQYKEQIKGLQIVASSLEEQNIILKEQVNSIQTVFDKGHANKTELLELKKRFQEIQGRWGEAKAHIATSNESIVETQLQMLDLENDNENKINDSLHEVQSQILSLQEQYEASKDVLERTTIKAPQAGIVTGLQYHTIGGVISPGIRIMDIVPQNDELLVEAHVMPKDIESVKINSIARVQLSAYKTRLVPRVDGEVIYISADILSDPKMGTPYFLAKIKIDPKKLNSINYDIQLIPGMPADVFIVKGERTFLTYLMSPIVDSFHRAFKEQ